MRDIDNFNIQKNSSDSILQLLAYLYDQNIMQCLQPATHDRKNTQHNRLETWLLQSLRKVDDSTPIADTRNYMVLA